MLEIPQQLRLTLAADGFTTEVYTERAWRAGSRVASRPLDALTPDALTADGYSGKGDGYSWQSRLSVDSGGIRVLTKLTVTKSVTIVPAMILWLAPLDSVDDRQAHTWRQTILRAPTVNAAGLGGNDLPACYLYDHATRTETICYWPPDAFAWTERRFCEWGLREIIRYRPDARYGLGLQATTPETTITLEPGTYTFDWWFTQRYRAAVPTQWEAQQALIEAVMPLLDRAPLLMGDGASWQAMAQATLADLQQDACWINVNGVSGLRAYVRGSSAVGRDEPRGFELMTQLDVLYPVLMWSRLTGNAPPTLLTERLLATLPHFDRPAERFVANGFPARNGDTFMDTWYFLENTLIKLAWVAHLSGSEPLKAMFLRGLEGARQMARQCAYIFPLFADATDWRMRQSLLNPGVGGLYAAGCVLGWQMTGDDAWLEEATQALRALHQLPPHMLTHEPQQLSFGAAAAGFLARQDGASDEWSHIAADLVRLSLRMGYWDKDASVQHYDPRGMFQACASLCYPAFKENVETLLPWSELMQPTAGEGAALPPALAKLMASFANLARCHNYAFFDAYLPQELRRGPCPAIPYEDLATAEFPYTAMLGKEIYGAGEVLWSALLFDALGHVDADSRDVLCLSLDVPALDLAALDSKERRFLVYNPSQRTRRVTVTTAVGACDVMLEPDAFAQVQMSSR